MTATDVAAWASVAMSLFSLASVFYFVGVKFATLQVKVDTMWEFTLRRGKSEAIRDGLAVMNSPIKPKPEALELMAPLADELRAVSAKSGVVSDADLAAQIEMSLGDKMLHKICIPNRMALGACLFLAVEYLKSLRREPARAV